MSSLPCCDTEQCRKTSIVPACRCAASDAYNMSVHADPLIHAAWLRTWRASRRSGCVCVHPACLEPRVPCQSRYPKIMCRCVPLYQSGVPHLRKTDELRGALCQQALLSRCSSLQCLELICDGNVQLPPSSISRCTKLAACKANHLLLYAPVDEQCPFRQRRGRQWPCMC